MPYLYYIRKLFFHPPKIYHTRDEDRDTQNDGHPNQVQWQMGSSKKGVSETFDYACHGIKPVKELILSRDLGAGIAYGGYPKYNL